MDPPLISDSTFSPAYSLAEIWPGMPHFPDHSHLTATAPTKGKDSTAADEVLSSTTTANLSNVITSFHLSQNHFCLLKLVLGLLFLYYY